MSNQRYEWYRDRVNRIICIKYCDNNSTLHFHNHIELTYVCEGTLVYDIGERQVTLENGDIALVGSGVVHGCHSLTHTRNYVLLVPIQSLSDMKDLFTENTFGADKFHDEGETLLPLFRALSDFDTRSGIYESIYVTLDRYSQNITNGLSQAILGTILRRVGIQHRHGSQESDDIKIMSYIHENFRLDISKEQIARKFGYTPYKLDKIFGDNLKMSIKNYIRMLRINEAKKLLETTQEKIDSISDAVGFECVRTFLRVFKEYCGVTPSEYRNNIC